MDIIIPENIRKIIGSRTYSINTVGLSESQVICFDNMVLKIEQRREESENEHRMMTWLSGRLPVPEVLCSHYEDGTCYLLMSKMAGEMACSPEILEKPGELVRMLAEGLQMLWSIDISECPYNNALENKLRLAEYRIQNNLCTMEDGDPDTYGENGFENPAALLAWLKENKPQEELVFSHGDYCLPNIFLKAGKISGFIDLGRSGISDKYQDIALCYRSLQYNYSGFYGGKVYEDFHPEMLFNQLEILPDMERINYYKLLDELF